MREQPTDSGAGIKNPIVFDTEAEALAHKQKVEALETSLLAMTPADRAEWYALNIPANIDDLLETVS